MAERGTGSRTHPPFKGQRSRSFVVTLEDSPRRAQQLEDDKRRIPVRNVARIAWSKRRLPPPAARPLPRGSAARAPRAWHPEPQPHRPPSPPPRRGFLREKAGGIPGKSNVAGLVRDGLTRLFRGPPRRGAVCRRRHHPGRHGWGYRRLGGHEDEARGRETFIFLPRLAGSPVLRGGRGVGRSTG